MPARLTRDRGCRNRFSEADWAKRVAARTTGFPPSSAPGGAGPPPPAGGATLREPADPTEWSLGPARPVHELDTIDRYEGKEHNFHFC